MKQCEFCGASMVNDAGFCGKCGRVPSQVAQRATRISDLSTIGMGAFSDLDNGEQTTILSESGKHMIPRSPSGVLRPVTLIPIHDAEEDEDEDEEKRKRAALFGISLPLLEEIANRPTPGQIPVMPGTPPMSQAPVLHGTPQIAHVPVLPNTPPIQGGPLFGPGSAAVPPPLPHIYQPQPLFSPPPVKPVKPPAGPSSPPPSNSPGCLLLGAVFLAAILIILATTFGLGLTVFAPGLSLSGNSTVTTGSNLVLHGHNFLPNGKVTLTLDSGIPLYSAQHQVPTQLSKSSNPGIASTGMVLYSFLQSASSNHISVQGDGTFNATIQISSTWSPGSHTIHALEDVSHRNASLPFTIEQNADASATPTVTPSPTQPVPTPTPTSTPSPTPTATPVPPPTLSCATPGSLALGPISEFSSQVASAKVTLCTAGSGTLTWKANWNQNQAPWLKLSQTTGTIQAPGQIQVTISASAAKLAAGTYTISVTFIGLESNTAQTVNVALTVKAGCVSVKPQGLRFSGVAGVSDPRITQTISVANCNLTSNWSAAIDNGSKWLSLSSSKGTLKGGSTTNVTVTASNLNAGLKAGTYQDTIIFTIGSDTASVSVTLVVQAAPPTITANPSGVNAADAPCTTNDAGNSVCTITLTNNSSTDALTWSASSNANNITVQADSTTIAAASTEQVAIVIPGDNCGTQLTITFTAPGNSATVTWNCTPAPPIR